MKHKTQNLYINKIFILLLIYNSLLFSCSSQKNNTSKTILNKNSIEKNNTTNKWYKIKSDIITGYSHYNIVEYDTIYKLKFNSKFKRNNDSIVYFNKSEIEYYKDSFLSVKSFDVWLNRGRSNKTYYFNGFVNNKLNWIIKDAYRVLNYKGEETMVELTEVKKEFNTEAPTLVDLNLLQFISNQNFNKKNQKINFNVMEIRRGPKYKKNRYLEYVSDELIQIKNQSFKTKKIIYKGNRTQGSSFWLDKNNTIVKFQINNVTFILVEKNEIDFSKFN